MKKLLALLFIILCFPALAQEIEPDMKANSYSRGNQLIQKNLLVKNGISIGTTYVATTAPTNGLIVQGTVGVGTTSPSATLSVNGSYATHSTGRAYNTGTTTDTIAAGKATTYESTNSATITLTFAAPAGDGERRRVCFNAISTVTWAVTSPATAVAGLPTSVIAGQCIEAVYNSASGTPTNAPATTWVVY